jgi:DNA-binding CsgD family transcriptional regulator
MTRLEIPEDSPILGPVMEDTEESRLRLIASICLGAFAAAALADIVLDNPENFLSLHVLMELLMVAFAVATIVWLQAGWRRTLTHLERTRRDLASRAAERDEWRGRAEGFLRGLGEEIDRQLREWELTPAERETALLLLKGFGHKEIAAIQEKSERTVRQHAVAVYRKSGLSGRAELSAYFLEDLLLPAEQPQPS